MEKKTAGLKDTFSGYIQKEDREKCVRLVLAALEQKEVDIPTLYEDILRPALTEISADDKPQEIQIWREHVQTSIVRTILECCYPYVIKERDENGQAKNGLTVLIICPAEEYHETGARMVTDYFTLCGYNAVFVGGNTPREDFISALDYINPAYVAISVSNYYHTVAAERTIRLIKEKKPDTAILVGGYAFNRNPALYKEIGADYYLSGYSDICKLGQGENS